ncbi:hypothetical protein EVA_18778 [gut metagenome]|uniref:Uncharacterized protein n=1 Tax=gut metagenome TaxID=749906 RepID=J9G0N0_9ZZZZ
MILALLVATLGFKTKTGFFVRSLVGSAGSLADKADVQSTLEIVGCSRAVGNCQFTLFSTTEILKVYRLRMETLPAWYSSGYS